MSITIKDRYIKWIGNGEYDEQHYNAYWGGFVEAVNAINHLPQRAMFDEGCKHAEKQTARDIQKMIIEHIDVAGKSNTPFIDLIRKINKKYFEDCKT